MGSATSVAASPRLTALGASLGLRLVFLAADFFFAAMSVPDITQNDARRARVREIRPGPVDEHDEPAAKSDQEKDVEQQPEPPRKDPGEPQVRKLRHCRVPADGCERAPVPITERRGGPASHMCPDVRRDVLAHLFGGGRNARDWLA